MVIALLFLVAADVLVFLTGERSAFLLLTISTLIIITCIKRFYLPNTLGGFYSTFTEFFGFKSNSEEGKLMALASYGKYSEKLQKKLNRFLKYDNLNGNFKLNPVLRFGGQRSKSPRFSDKFISIFGKPLKKKSQISK